MLQTPIITDFSAGELGPKFSGRQELAIYNKGAKKLENWIPFTQGGVTTAPGLKYLGATKGGADARLLAFDVGTYHFVLELGASYIRVWSGDARFQTYGSDVEITTTYTLAEVWKLQVQQVCNALYLVCDTHPPMVLTWTGVTFTFAALPITCGDSIIAWVKNTAYVQDDLRINDGKVYQCITAGTSAALTNPAARAWQTICWSPALGLFCAVANDGAAAGQVMTSPDGITWAPQASASAQTWTSVTWSPALNLFCAVASNGAVGVQIMTSPNGTTWTSRASASARQWRSVCWSPALALFCAVAADGLAATQVMTSANGTDWVSRTSAIAKPWVSVAWSPALGKFCAVADNGALYLSMTSSNGIDWASLEVAGDLSMRSVCWSPERGLFCAVADGSDAGMVFTSAGDNIWPSHDSASAQTWTSVCWSSVLGLFCAVAYTGAVGVQIMTSTNAIGWTSRTSAAAQQWTSVVWSPELGLLCAVSDNGTNRAMCSLDGITWSGTAPAGPRWETADITDGTVHWEYVYQTPFSCVGDYPACVAHFAGRMFFAASVAQPQTAWASRPFEYGDFNYSDAISYEVTDLKDAALWASPTVPETVTTTVRKTVYGEGNAFFFEIASDQNDTILWLAGADSLVIGTSASEWVLPPSVTALDIQPKRRSGLGSAAIQGQMFGDNPVFVQGGAGIAFLREYAYNSQSAELQSPDLTFAAEHMLEDGVEQMDFQQLPHPVMNVVTKTGEISALLYNKPYGVTAWHRLVSAVRLYESVAVVAGASEDAVYVIVSHDAAYTIERFNSLWGTTDQCLESWSAHTVANFIDRGDCESVTPPMVAGETVPLLSNATFARDATWAHGGASSYKVTKTVAAGTGANVQLTDNNSVTDMHGFVAGQTVTLSQWIKVPSGGILGSEIQLEIWDFLGAAWASTVQACANVYDTPQLVTVTRTLRIGCTGVRIFGANLTSTAALNEYFYVDDIEILLQTGLSRLNGHTATIINLTDGTTHTAAVAAGSLAYPTGDGVGDSVVIGLTYICDGQTMKIPTQTRTGLSGMGQLKRIANVVMRVLASFPFKVSGDGTTWETARRPDGAAWTAAYTGDVLVPVPGDWNRDGCLYFRQDLPQRTTILALVPEIDA